jgi:excisionase family DNA binding protein
LWKFVAKWRHMARKKKHPDYLTAQEVADRCRVSRRTVYNWIGEGLLIAERAGPKIWLVSEEALAAFLKRGRVYGAGSASSAWLPGEASKQQQRVLGASRAPQRPAPQRPVQPSAQAEPQQVAVPLGFDLREVQQRADDTPPSRPGSLPPAQLSSSKKKKPGGRKR